YEFTIKAALVTEQPTAGNGIAQELGDRKALQLVEFKACDRQKTLVGRHDPLAVRDDYPFNRNIGELADAPLLGLATLLGLEELECRQRHEPNAEHAKHERAYAEQGDTQVMSRGNAIRRFHKCYVRLTF